MNKFIIVNENGTKQSIDFNKDLILDVQSGQQFYFDSSFKSFNLTINESNADITFFIKGQEYTLTLNNFVDLINNNYREKDSSVTAVVIAKDSEGNSDIETILSKDDFKSDDIILSLKKMFENSADSTKDGVIIDDFSALTENLDSSKSNESENHDTQGTPTLNGNENNLRDLTENLSREALLEANQNNEVEFITRENKVEKVETIVVSNIELTRTDFVGYEGHNLDNSVEYLISKSAGTTTEVDTTFTLEAIDGELREDNIEILLNGEVWEDFDFTTLSGEITFDSSAKDMLIKIVAKDDADSIHKSMQATIVTEAVDTTFNEDAIKTYLNDDEGYDLSFEAKDDAQLRFYDDYQLYDVSRGISTVISGQENYERVFSAGSIDTGNIFDLKTDESNRSNISNDFMNGQDIGIDILKMELTSFTYINEDGNSTVFSDFNSDSTVFETLETIQGTMKINIFGDYEYLSGKLLLDASNEPILDDNGNVRYVTDAQFQDNIFDSFDYTTSTSGFSDVDASNTNEGTFRFGNLGTNGDEATDSTLRSRRGVLEFDIDASVETEIMVDSFNSSNSITNDSGDSRRVGSNYRNAEYEGTYGKLTVRNLEGLADDEDSIGTGYSILIYTLNNDSAVSLSSLDTEQDIFQVIASDGSYVEMTVNVTGSNTDEIIPTILALSDETIDLTNEDLVNKIDIVKNLNLENGTAQTLDISIDDILSGDSEQLNEDFILKIIGDSSDNINLEGDWSDLGSHVIDNEVYKVFQGVNTTNNSTIKILIDEDVTFEI